MSAAATIDDANSTRPHDDADSLTTANHEGDWKCPVCCTPVPHPHRPGRARVYCTNSCKQRAYRWRRDHRHELRAPSPPERARTFDRVHALRSDADPITALSRPTQRASVRQRVTACGTFATAARDTPDRFAHTTFHATGHAVDQGHPFGTRNSATEGAVGRRVNSPRTLDSGVCASCTRLLDVPIVDMAAVFSDLGLTAHRFGLAA